LCGKHRPTICAKRDNCDYERWLGRKPWMQLGGQARRSQRVSILQRQDDPKLGGRPCHGRLFSSKGSAARAGTGGSLPARVRFPSAVCTSHSSGPADFESLPGYDLPRKMSGSCGEVRVTGVVNFQSGVALGKETSILRVLHCEKTEPISGSSCSICGYRRVSAGRSIWKG
jgi:hypothetical protein